jgi:hypothetical protein
LSIIYATTGTFGSTFGKGCERALRKKSRLRW